MYLPELPECIDISVCFVILFFFKTIASNTIRLTSDAYITGYLLPSDSQEASQAAH